MTYFCQTAILSIRFLIWFSKMCLTRCREVLLLPRGQILKQKQRILFYVHQWHPTGFSENTILKLISRSHNIFTYIYNIYEYKVLLSVLVVFSTSVSACRAQHPLSYSPALTEMTVIIFSVLILFNTKIDLWFTSPRGVRTCTDMHSKHTHTFSVWRRTTATCTPL